MVNDWGPKGPPGNPVLQPEIPVDELVMVIVIREAKRRGRRLLAIWLTTNSLDTRVAPLLDVMISLLD
jgi:hypothetical protein